MKKPMSDKRDKINIKKSKAGDTIKGIDPKTKKVRDFKFVKERIIKDDDGNIIGVEKIWQ
tara:strand:+ start:488 stop:667 length:180 start_codon:yes stop_codon:yes gene_type:complete